MRRMRSTTILAVRHKGGVALGGDGQVTLGNVVMKSDAHKIRRLHDGKVLTGFAGSSADAFALLERFEAKLKDYQGSVPLVLDLSSPLAICVSRICVHPCLSVVGSPL